MSGIKSVIVGKFANESHKIRPGDHLVHVYEEKKSLHEAVSSFILPGLTGNEGVVIIAAPENIKKFEFELEKRSIDVSKAKMLGQMVIFDAQEILDKISTENKIDPVKFNTAVESILTALSVSRNSVRAYGEIVNLLWNSGRQECAIELERLWTQLGNLHKFSLLCGYSFDDLKSSQEHSCFDQICTCHTHIITPDGILKISK